MSAAAQPSYRDACFVERRGMSVLLPHLETRAWRGRVLNVATGPLARTFQRRFGDLLVATSANAVSSVEVKTERRWTGNAFLEVWSNKNLNDRGNHIERGSTPGWLVTCRADVLALHFLDLDQVMFLPLFRLQQWAFGAGGRKARIYDFPERQQRAYAQLNDSWGRVVPLDVIAAEVGAKRACLRQETLNFAGN